MADYDIRPLQLRILKILLAVDKVCKEHGLRYYIMAGTMLGAVRHKGFIPWDDDLDIGSVKRIERVSLRYETLKSTFIEDIIQTFFGNHNLQFPEKRFCISGRHLLDANRLANSSGYGARLTDFQHLAIIVRYYLDFLFPQCMMVQSQRIRLTISKQLGYNLRVKKDIAVQQQNVLFIYIRPCKP